MNLLQKYLLLMFLVANATAEYLMFMSVSKYLFYGVLIISVPFMFKKNVMSSDAVRQCPDIYFVGFILFAYELIFGLSDVNSGSVIYLVGKLLSFGIMMLCIDSNFEFYLKKFIIPFSYIILFLIVLGWITHPKTGTGYVFGFINRNAACTMASIGFAGFLYGRDYFSKIDYACMAVLFITILVGGSRNSLTMCIIFIMIRYGLSWKLVSITAILCVLIMFVLPEVGIRIEAFERLLGTITGDVSLDREAQRRGAIMMIEQRPWIGWGLASQIQGQALAVSHVGAHNGYLTMIMYLGLPLGCLYLLTLAVGALKRMRLYFLNDNAAKFHLAVIWAVIFAANQEDYLVGVNQITTNIFYVSFVVTGIYIYRVMNDIPVYQDSECKDSQDGDEDETDY